MKGTLSNVSRGVLGLWLLLATTQSTWGQWTTQTIQLRPGWNAVFLEVQPEPRESDAVLAGLPIESVWRWNRRFNPVEFIQDPTSLVPAQPDWLVYLPPAHALAGQSTLYTIDGCHAYLIKVADNAAPVTWSVQGKVVARKTEWLSDSFNFVGQVLPANPPSFQTFFGGSVAHSNQPVFRLSAQGTWQQIPVTTLMQRGEAFWIRCNGQSDFQGPLNVTLAQRTGLDYGRLLVEQTVKIKNTSATTKTVQLKKVDSANPPPGSSSSLAGQVALNYWKTGTANEAPAWAPLPAILTTSLAAGQEWEIRLEVKRTAMTAALASRQASSGSFATTGPPPSPAVFQSIVEITDAANSVRAAIPVLAEGLQQGGLGAPHARAGLWVGNAEITHINQPSSINPTNPLPTAAPFQFRVLVHVDQNGEAQLLQKVLQMWKTGTYRTNENGIREVDQPGRLVLVTDDSLIPNFGGSALRDGEPVARRFSSAVFAFKQPISMTRRGDFGADGGDYSCGVVLDYDDPLNPFKHGYHPDHDNLDARFTQKLPEGRESFTVTRQVQIRFTNTDPDNLTLPGWGDTQLGGVYGETITGLHKTPLHLRGTIRLHRASLVPVLNN